MAEDNLSYLLPEQIGVLLAAIKPHRVGRDGKGFSHVEAYELRAHLIRLFGFARWSEEVLEQECIFEDSEQKQGKKGTYTAWTVCYRSLVRLTVRAPDGTLLATYTEGATGDATNQPSRSDAHDLALKTSASQAFKRCCMNLGDSFGLSLYRKGSLDPLVKVTLVDGKGGAAGAHAGTDIQDAAPVTHRAADMEPTIHDDLRAQIMERARQEGRGLQEVAEAFYLVYGEDIREASEENLRAFLSAPWVDRPADTAMARAVQESVLAAADDAGGGNPEPPAKSPEEFRDILLAAETKADVRRTLRDIGLAGHSDAEVTNAKGENLGSLTTLATRLMKELAS